MPQHRPPPPSGDQARAEREQAATRLADSLAGSPQDRAQTIARLGGPAKVAAMVGRSTRTVQRWASGSIKNPKTDALAILNRADVLDRLGKRGINVDSGGKPYRKVSFQARGKVRIQGPSRTPEYRYDRRIGPQQPLGINSDTMAAMIDRLSSGDNEGALQLLERDLTRDYAACGDAYDPESGLGFRFESLTEATFYTDAAGEELY